MVKSISYKIVWDRVALDHFKEILSFLETQSALAPKIVKDAIILRLDSIKRNPLICEVDKLREPSDKDFRAFVVFSYRVTFQIKPKQKVIYILRIRHTGREPLSY
jgi:plasmid stabilization system protein ParE